MNRADDREVWQTIKSNVRLVHANTSYALKVRSIFIIQDQKAILNLIENTVKHVQNRKLLQTFSLSVSHIHKYR